MKTTEYKPGVFYPPHLNVWPHEKATAKALADAGYYVEFRAPSSRKGAKSPDCFLNGVLWEMKSPRASSLKAVERNLKRGKWQSDRIIFDSRRMKGVPDAAIERELRARFDDIPEIKAIIFVGRGEKMVDIP